jgi:hypothetical protein
MQGHRQIVAGILLALIAFGCASTNEPSRWLPDPKEVPTDAYGGWIRVQIDDGELSGELIAISSDTLFLADSVLQALPVREIQSARVVVFDVDAGIGAGTFFGSLITFPLNGLFLIFTAPMWWIGGTIAGVARTYDPVVDFPKSRIDDLRPFARFPQGLPPGVDYLDITMRPQRARR